MFSNETSDKASCIGRIMSKVELKPGQDFSRTSRQKTCPNGHKESEDCHSAYVQLRCCTPSERQSSSSQQYPCLRPGYRKRKRSGGFSHSPSANLANSAILPTANISTFYCYLILSRSHKTESCYAKSA